VLARPSPSPQLIGHKPDSCARTRPQQAEMRPIEHPAQIEARGRQPVAAGSFRDQLPGERTDRTQEVAGSSPASSMLEGPARAGLSVSGVRSRWAGIGAVVKCWSSGFADTQRARTTSGRRCMRRRGFDRLLAGGWARSRLSALGLASTAGALELDGSMAENPVLLSPMGLRRRTSGASSVPRVRHGLSLLRSSTSRKGVWSPMWTERTG
jgi:hypothetical protein